MKPTRGLVILALSLATWPNPSAAAPADARVAKAKSLFANYVRLSRASDPAIADLYADEARIRNKRTDSSGQIVHMTLDARRYKALVRKVMPLAKARGDLDTYSQVTYTPERDGVRIKADRYSELKKYHSPVSILARPSPSGAWLIYEELSETRP